MATFQTPTRVQPSSTPFKNEPLTDFSRSENARGMRDAIEKVRGQLGREYDLVIGGRRLKTASKIKSINPARPSEVVGLHQKAGAEHGEPAMQAALKAFESWKRTSVEERAALLQRTAAIVRERKFEFNAWMVFEVGKNWAEADADVAETIDFLEFYSREALRLSKAEPPVQLPGEHDHLWYIPLGVGAVIPPWNFPMAIMAGMTTAAVVCGNTVILKPSSESPTIAAKFFEALVEAGMPEGVVNFCPGSGTEFGTRVVEHPKTRFIAFTGSREVGLRIWESAGKTRPGQRELKRVVCEMGGKNAIIVDSDADLDETIVDTIYSGFGYQGQKCSACSRLIVLEENYERVMQRLLAAAASLRVGNPEDPGITVGPVIDETAYRRIQEIVERGKTEATLAFQATHIPEKGYFIPPTIFTGVKPEMTLSQCEIFGPVLSVLKARDLDDAIRIANDTDYALTAGFFSRSPANIERIKGELVAGNVYVNRSCNRAVVGRHPFGGFKMSGGGTKAGGSDYLLNFLVPRVVTENIMRHGFAPEATPEYRAEFL